MLYQNLYSKIESCFVPFIAPGSYDVEKSEKIIHQSSGAITFGIKYKEQKPDDIPGENKHIDKLSICAKQHLRTKS